VPALACESVWIKSTSGFEASVGCATWCATWWSIKSAIQPAS
jgi:hypothetical protein